FPPSRSLTAPSPSKNISRSLPSTQTSLISADSSAQKPSASWLCSPPSNAPFSSAAQPLARRALTTKPMSSFATLLDVINSHPVLKNSGAYYGPHRHLANL